MARRNNFTLRLLSGAVTLAAILFALFGRSIVSRIHLANTVKALRADGATVLPGSITTIGYYNIPITADMASRIAAFSGPINLTINGGDITSDVFSKLTSNKITSLAIGNCKLTQGHLDALSRIPSIHELWLGNTSLSKLDLKQIGMMTGLSDASFFNTSLAPHHFRALASSQSINTLTIGWNSPRKVDSESVLTTG